MATRSYLRERLSAAGAQATPGPLPQQDRPADTPTYVQLRVDTSISTDEYHGLCNRVRDRLIELTKGNELLQPHDHALMSTMKEHISEILEQHEPWIPATGRSVYVERLVHDLVGFGAIQPLIDDPDITEIMVNRSDDIWVEKRGRLQRETSMKFRDDEAVRQLAERIALPLRRRIDDRHPILDARLPDGSRVCATLSPPALDGCVITIRKFNRRIMGVEGLLQSGTLSPEVHTFLQRCVEARCNILVAGGTSCGKTTVLNGLSSMIPPDERVITIEDAAELQLQQEHVLRYETRQGNAEGKGAITIRDLVRTSLRLRPDRIIVGEVRGAEALDMIQANNTGHDGGFSTLHANSARDALSRLETLVLLADSGLPLRAIRQQVASAFDLLISCIRLKDGRRRLGEIVEVAGIEGDDYRLHCLWRYDYASDRMIRVAGEGARLADRFSRNAGGSMQPC